MINSEQFDIQFQDMALFARIIPPHASLMNLKCITEKKVCIADDITGEIPINNIKDYNNYYC